MSWRTHPIVTQIRTAARKVGLTVFLARILSSHGYETAFEQDLFTEIREGDVIWDVGANVGLYTNKFAHAVGVSGTVFAFEPLPTIAQQLRENVSDIRNVSVNAVALGASCGIMRMQAGVDSLGATSRIVEGPAAAIQIEMLTGDAAVHEGLAACPNVVKIDTEGFELDVLKGMGELLRNPGLRAIYIEVHFGLLAERGIPNAPAHIEKLLAAQGFRTRWVDPSHLAATRDCFPSG
jgi:FkbM family methyltransferase